MNITIKELALSSALMIVALSAVLIINATGQQTQVADTESLDFATLPTIYGSILLVLSAIFFLGSLRQFLSAKQRIPSEKTESAESDSPSSRLVVTRIVLTLVILVAYVVLLEYVQFLVVTSLFLFAMFWVFGQRSLWKMAALALLGGAGFHGLFIYVLDLPI